MQKVFRLSVLAKNYTHLHFQLTWTQAWEQINSCGKFSDWNSLKGNREFNPTDSVEKYNLMVTKEVQDEGNRTLLCLIDHTVMKPQKNHPTSPYFL